MYKDEVIILLATYNGEKYLSEQLDSILEQTYPCWRLLISDDGSTDGTLSLLQDYQNKHADKISILPTKCRFGSAKGNFFNLMKQSMSGYVMFCDQDDVWYKDKIEKTLIAMKQMELETTMVCPLLVFTDLCVVNADMHLIADSFMRFSGLDGYRTAFHQLLIQNVVTGCTVMINDQLRQLALEYQDDTDILMHDWWIALVASAFGRVRFLNIVTISYRQHTKNVVGAKNTHSIGYLIKKVYMYKSIRKALMATTQQASLLSNTYNDRLSDAQRSLISQYAQIYTHGKMKRIFFICKHRIFKNGVMRKIAQVIWG